MGFSSTASICMDALHLPEIKYDAMLVELLGRLSSFDSQSILFWTDSDTNFTLQLVSICDCDSSGSMPVAVWSSSYAPLSHH
jgi:hypothetical protein